MGVDESDSSKFKLGTTAIETSTRMTIDNSGNVGIGITSPVEKMEVDGNISATSFLFSSDRRLKKNIKPITGLEHILKLQGVCFDWKESGDPSVGLVAQDVEGVLPELVSTNSITGLKSVQYANLVAVLIEAVKELKTENDYIKKITMTFQEENRTLKVENKQFVKALASLTDRQTTLEEMFLATSTTLPKSPRRLLSGEEKMAKLDNKTINN